MDAGNAAGGILFFLLILCWLVLIPIWTYRDAEKNGLNPKLSLLLVLFCPAGILFYLIYRNHKKRP